MMRSTRLVCQIMSSIMRGSQRASADQTHGKFVRKPKEAQRIHCGFGGRVIGMSSEALSAQRQNHGPWRRPPSAACQAMKRSRRKAIWPMASPPVSPQSQGESAPADTAAQPPRLPRRASPSDKCRLLLMPPMAMPPLAKSTPMAMSPMAIHPTAGRSFSSCGPARAQYAPAASPAMSSGCDIQRSSRQPGMFKAATLRIHQHALLLADPAPLPIALRTNESAQQDHHIRQEQTGNDERHGQLRMRIPEQAWPA